MQELGNKDEENARIKRELNAMKVAAAPAATHNVKAARARKEESKLATELKQKDAMRDATQKALKGRVNQSVKNHLETLLKNTERSIARINAQRKMWKEEEARHCMDALSALSLLEDSQFKVVRDLIPDYSPFKRSTKIDSLISRIGLRKDSQYYYDIYGTERQTPTERSFSSDKGLNFEAIPMSKLHKEMLEKSLIE